MMVATSYTSFNFELWSDLHQLDKFDLIRACEA